MGALDAFVDGSERRVDLAEVNGRVFVNNVWLGLYADAVQHEGYRNAKLRTILDTVPEVLGPEATGLNLRWTSPSGHQHQSGAAILVSNNRYRLGRAIGSGTRPKIDDGLLGITVAAAPMGAGKSERRPRRPWREWTASGFEVDSDRLVPAASTARPSAWSRRCAFESAPAYCASGSPVGIPAPHRRQVSPKASGRALAPSPESLPDVNRTTRRSIHGRLRGRN